MSDNLNELPRVARSRMLTIAAWFNGGAATLFLVLFLRCTTLLGTKTDKLWNDRLNDLKEQLEKSGSQKIQEADRKITPVIDETQRMIDSLNQRLEVLKAKKS